jgi:hypothetical protein
MPPTLERSDETHEHGGDYAEAEAEQQKRMRENTPGFRLYFNGVERGVMGVRARTNGRSVGAGVVRTGVVGSGVGGGVGAGEGVGGGVDGSWFRAVALIKWRA